MIRDITIGQYYPTDSVIHKLDPRVKIVCTLLYLISLFLFKSVLGYVICTVFLVAVIRTSIQIYNKRIEADHSASSDHNHIQPVFHNNGKYTCIRWIY